MGVLATLTGLPAGYSLWVRLFSPRMGQKEVFQERLCFWLALTI
jgi:hypothetical protein